MRPYILETAAKLCAVVCGALVMAAAWSSYRNPALGLLLAAVRFCG